jgi:hypothetical protein
MDVPFGQRACNGGCQRSTIMRFPLEKMSPAHVASRAPSFFRRWGPTLWLPYPTVPYRSRPRRILDGREQQLHQIYLHPVVILQTPDVKKEEFRKYLEKAGGESTAQQKACGRGVAVSSPHHPFLFVFFSFLTCSSRCTHKSVGWSLRGA